MTKDEALRLALEALQELEDTNSYWWQEVDEATTKKIDPAITAIKAALETKEESWEKFCDSHCVWTDHHPDCKLAKDEPVVFNTLASLKHKKTVGPIEIAMSNTTPPQRTWVGLNDEEIAEVEDEYIVDYRIPAGSAWNFAKDIEAKLRSKNYD